MKHLPRWLIAAVASMLCMGAAHACDTWVALRDATADHSVILAKNSDRPPMEPQPLIQVPHATHEPGEKVKCTYVTIPQARETYEHIGSKIWWAFGYEHGMNEHGVAIGNEAVGTATLITTPNLTYECAPTAFIPAHTAMSCGQDSEWCRRVGAIRWVLPVPGRG